MATQTRPPLIIKHELRSYAAALHSQALGRGDHLLDSLDRFPTGIGRGPTYDYPNPSWAKVDQRLGEAGRSEGQVWSNRLLDLLLSKDKFFTTAGMGPDYDYPNPRAALRATVYEVSGQDLLGTLLAKKPFNQNDHPNPRAAPFPSHLRTHLDPLKLSLRSKDAFFGLAGNPTFDWPVPKGAPPLAYQQPPPNNLPALFTVLSAPFHLLDWPNPAAARDRGIAARAWNEGWQNPIVNVLPMPLSQFDWPLPRGAAYPQNLRVFYPTPFIWQFDIGTITDTDILQKPVNVVMAGDVPIKDRWREFDIRPLDLKTKPVATGSPTRRLRGDKPSFTVKTDKKGYD